MPSNNTFYQGDLLKNQRFLIQRKLGSSGQGSVYLVADRQNNNSVWALKALTIDRRDTEDDRKTNLQLFQQEAEMLKQFSHPNITAFHDYFSHSNGTPCLVMEFVEGQTLEQKSGSIPASSYLLEDEVLGWAVQIAQVFEYFHNLTPPIIYRDLKPGNLMLTPEGRIKLIDFGIARRLKANQRRGNTICMGTPGFSPPEAYGTDPTYWGASDKTSDVYTYGATIYNLLLGTVPKSFETSPKLCELPNWLRNLGRNDLKLGTIELIKKCMGFQKKDRFQDFTEVLNHLRNYNYVPIDSHVPPPLQPPVTTFPCGHCGNQVRIGGKFCNKCGYPTVTGPLNFSNKVPQFDLRVNGYNSQISIIKLPYLIGKRDMQGNVPDLDLEKFDTIKAISRRHAQIRMENNQYIIVDLNSTNGTKLNNIPLVPNKAYPIRNGDRIILSAQVELRFLHTT